MEALNARWSKAVADAERERADGSLESRAALAERFALDAAVAGAFSRALATEEETASGRFPLPDFAALRPESLAPPRGTTLDHGVALAENEAPRNARVAEPADGARKALFSYDDDESVADSPHATEALSPETQKRKPDRSLDSLPADVVAPATRARATWAAHQLAARAEGLASGARPLRRARGGYERDAVIAEGPPSARTSPRRSGARRTPSTSRRRRGRRRWRRGRRPRRRAS